MTTQAEQSQTGNDDGAPPFRYTAAMAADIEARWQDRWEAEGTFNAPNPTGPLAPADGAPVPQDKLYLLDMFPYPSGKGLHVGHPLGYIGTDVMGRYMRMIGRNVLHTIGYDAFGLPAEQYAVRTGTHPRTTTEANITRYRAQLRRLGFGHDQRRSVATTDPEFFRWTQWIFTQLFEAWYDDSVGRARPISALVEQFESGDRQLAGGRTWADLSHAEQHQVLAGHRLAYIDEAPVNWCPGLGTVLSNEEVTPDGKSAIGNFPVFRRNLRQWMMRITAYADRLLDDLDRLDWPESVKSMQRNWIGRSYGARLTFPVAAEGQLRGRATDIGRPDGVIEVYTTRPDTLFGATYMVLAPEHPLIDVITAAQWPERTDCALDRRRGNPGRGCRRVPAGGGEQDRPGPPGEQGEDRRLHRRVRGEPGQRRTAAGVHRRLRADGLRHRGDHGRPRAGHPRLGFRHRLRAADHPHRAAAGRSSRRPGVRRRRAGDQQRQYRDLAGRAGCRRGEGQDDRLAGGQGLRSSRSGSTSCGTGCSPGSGTGANHSRSSMTRTAWPLRCPTTSCR